jgi:hypothetical protein
MGLILKVLGLSKGFFVARAISWYFLSSIVVFCSSWTQILILVMLGYFMSYYMARANS